MSNLPFCAARWSAVRPSLFAKSSRQPAWSNSWMISSRPLSAAIINGVQSPRFKASMFTLHSLARKRTHSSESMASCIGCRPTNIVSPDYSACIYKYCPLYHAHWPPRDLHCTVSAIAAPARNERELQSVRKRLRGYPLHPSTWTDCRFARIQQVSVGLCWDRICAWRLCSGSLSPFFTCQKIHAILEHSRCLPHLIFSKFRPSELFNPLGNEPLLPSLTIRNRECK